MTMYQLNQELNGVEIYFNSKPIQDIINQLKENKFRWNGLKKCWYAKQSNNTIAIAEAMTNGNITDGEAQLQAPKAKATKKALSLYDRLQFKEGSTDTSKYHWRYTGSNYTGLSVKETAKEIRSILKKQFPEVKFSVTSDYSKISILIKESPYSNIEPEYNPEITNYMRREEEKQLNKELYAILDYCKSLLNSYNYDDSDSMTDYFNTHFYTNVSIDYDYKQTEQTEGVKNDITNFRNQLLEDAKAEEIEREKQYQIYLAEQAEREKQYKIRQEEEKKEIEYINNNVEVKELTEQDQYFVIGSQFAHMNKNQRLETYIKEVSNGEFSLEDVKITREVYLDNKAYEYFNNMLSTDFEFLENTGGSYTDDKRINSMIDYDNMTPEERETVKFNLLGVAIYLNNELQYIVDAQGYSYARYVGLVDNVTITKDYTFQQLVTDEEIELLKTKADTLMDISTTIIDSNNLINTWNNENWKQYKELIKDKLKEYNIRLSKAIIQQIPEGMEELKLSMYKLLVEVDSIQEQFKEADLQQGQKITIFRISDFGMISTTHITVDKVEPSTYAQYTDVIKLTGTPKGKKGLYYSHYYKDLLIYNSWVELPKSVLFKTKQENGFTITSGLFSSCDNGQYDAILEYFTSQGLKPIINTYKPIF